MIIADTIVFLYPLFWLILVNKAYNTVKPNIKYIITAKLAKIILSNIFIYII